MTKEKLKQLNEMDILLQGLAAVTDALNKLHVDIAICTGCEDISYASMQVRRDPDFEQAFGDFIRSYYAKLQQEFDNA